jgi:hypothetical protein
LKSRGTGHDDYHRWFSTTGETGIVEVILHQILHSSCGLDMLSHVIFSLDILMFTAALAVLLVPRDLWAYAPPSNSISLPDTIPKAFTVITKMVVPVFVPAWALGMRRWTRLSGR